MTTHHTYGGGIDQTAIIGHPPESREWTPDSPTFAPEIDPTARIEAFATVDSGTIRPTVVASNAWLFKHCHVGHDAVICQGAEIGTGAIIGGHAVIGEGARIGLGAVVLPHRRVGAGAQVGAGAVVTKDVPDDVTVVGNPATILNPEKRNVWPHTLRPYEQRVAR